MPDLTALVETWRGGCADFVALARSLPEDEWALPTDLPGWSVKDNVAHTAHLEAVLAGAPEETVEVAAAAHLTGSMSVYTEQGVLARRGRDMESLCAEIEESVAKRYAELQADPPTDPRADPARTPGGIGWDTGTLLSNRPFDVWMHEQDIRRAVGRPGGFGGPAAEHVLTVLGRALPMVVGKRLSPPPGTVVRVEVPEGDRSWTIAVDDHGRAALVDDTRATTTVRLSAEDFVVLGGGRRAPGQTAPIIEGDRELGRRLLPLLAVTP